MYINTKFRILFLYKVISMLYAFNVWINTAALEILVKISSSNNQSKGWVLVAPIASQQNNLSHALHIGRLHTYGKQNLHCIHYIMSLSTWMEH